jgi:hypothetical protein
MHQIEIEIDELIGSDSQRSALIINYNSSINKLSFAQLAGNVFRLGDVVDF